MKNTDDRHPIPRPRAVVPDTPDPDCTEDNATYFLVHYLPCRNQVFTHTLKPRVFSLRSEQLKVHSDPPRRPQRPNLLIREHPRPDQKPNTLPVLQRKHPPAPRHHIQNQLRVLPVLKLALAHIKRSLTQGSHQHIAIADQKLPPRITHRGAAVAAASRLMKHQLPMLRLEPAHQLLS